MTLLGYLEKKGDIVYGTVVTFKDTKVCRQKLRPRYFSTATTWSAITCSKGEDKL